MEVLYRSTRGNEESVSASKAILEGLASDGGLFVPQALPSFDKTLDEFAQMDYRQTAYEVMKLLLTDFTEEELRYCIDKAYDGKFDTEAIAPLAEVKNAWSPEIPERRLWQVLRMCPARELWSFIPRTVLARFRKNRWSPRPAQTPA